MLAILATLWVTGDFVGFGKRYLFVSNAIHSCVESEKNRKKEITEKWVEGEGPLGFWLRFLTNRQERIGWEEKRREGESGGRRAVERVE